MAEQYYNVPAEALTAGVLKGCWWAALKPEVALTLLALKGGESSTLTAQCHTMLLKPKPYQ